MKEQINHIRSWASNARSAHLPLPLAGKHDADEKTEPRQKRDLGFSCRSFFQLCLLDQIAKLAIEVSTESSHKRQARGPRCFPYLGQRRTPPGPRTRHGR